MRLAICMITYNRLDYTKRALKSLLDTVEGDHRIVVSDNHSTDGTQEWLKEQPVESIFNIKNYYPGRACNIGWEHLLKDYDATHLMRIDNDMELAPGWVKRAEEYFAAFPKLGQLGLDYSPVGMVDHPEYRLIRSGDMAINPWPGNIGGTHIMKRELWNKGITYDGRSWCVKDNKPTPQEDCKLSVAIKKAGYQIGHMTEKYGWSFESIDDYPDYYRETYKRRGYQHLAPHLFND